MSPNETLLDYLQDQTKNADKNGFYALFTPSKMKNGHQKLEHLQAFIQYFTQMKFKMSSNLHKIYSQFESANSLWGK